MRDLESVSAAGRQAGQVLRSKKATSEQKKEAVKVLGTAVAGEVAKKTAEHVAREGRKALREPHVREAIKSAASNVGVPLAKATLVGALVAGTLAAGGAALTSNREKEAKRWADQQLADTRKRLGTALTPEQAKTLWQQYYAFALKQPVQNTYLGK